MNVVMIEPQIPTPHFLSEFHIPRLGLPLLGTILKEQGHGVKIFVEGIKPIDWGEVKKADVVCISILTPTAPRSYLLAKEIRRRGIPVIMGGIHATFCPDEALDFADYVIRYEAEEALPQLITALENGKPLATVPNLSYNYNGEKLHNHLSPKVPNLDDFPFPDFYLIQGWDSSFVTPIETSRGCPFSCKFCCVHKMFKKVRFRNIEKVVEEIERLKPRHIFFCDDNFVLNPERTKKLLQQILERMPKPPMWSAQVRIDIVTKAKGLLEVIKKTRCWRLFAGLESVNPDTLNEYNKRQTVTEIEEGVRLLRKRGIKVHGMFVLGADSDRIETVEQTIEFSKRAKIDSIQLTILTPLPGTSLYQQLQREGRLFPHGWREWAKFDGTNVLFKLATMDKSQLEAMIFKGMKRFYSWWEIIKSLLRWEFVNAAVKLYARRAITKIEKAKDLASGKGKVNDKEEKISYQ
jgi:radical SAM superfamily enzyme YgiQ (UPF0313 family)